jgi:hypothetical protein
VPRRGLRLPTKGQERYLPLRRTGLDILSNFRETAVTAAVDRCGCSTVCRMDCTFHVERGGVADWGDWRAGDPTVHGGLAYSVISAVCWLGDGLTCIVAVTPRDR